MSGKTDELLDRLAAVECPAFRHRREEREGPSPIVLARGDGCYVWDVDDRRYLDLAAGFGSVLLGHGHPAVRKAIEEQSARLAQGLGDVYASDTKLALLEALAALHPAGDAWVSDEPARSESPLGVNRALRRERGSLVRPPKGSPKGLLGQNGGDAITAAMKTATLATGRRAFIAFDGAYHGLGYAPLAACGLSRSLRAPFGEQLSTHVHFAPYPGVRGASASASVAMVRDLLDNDVAAIIVEPVLGRGGCVLPPDDFVAELCALAKTKGALVIADEIWTGLGRCGAMLCSADAKPDIVCLGKGLGGGLSISACIGSDAVMSGWKKGQTEPTSTHAGAPLACATALATLATVEREGLVERAATTGNNALSALREMLDGVATVRGRGLMIGVQLQSEAQAQRAIGELLEAGYLVISGGIDGDVLTLTPALTIELDALVGFGEAVRTILAG